MDVSKNRGTPKSSIFIGFSLINHPFWGFYPYFWKHPCQLQDFFHPTCPVSCLVLEGISIPATGLGRGQTTHGKSSLRKGKANFVRPTLGPIDKGLSITSDSFAYGLQLHLQLRCHFWRIGEVWCQVDFFGSKIHNKKHVLSKTLWGSTLFFHDDSVTLVDQLPVGSIVKLLNQQKYWSYILLT